MDKETMRAYTIKEVSKKINVPSGTIRQWEKDLNGLLIIPRTKQGARLYTDIEISLLQNIKQMRDKNLSKEMIRELLQKHLEIKSEEGSEIVETSLTPVTENRETPLAAEVPIARETAGAEEFFKALETFKQQLIFEVKEEIRNGMRKEVIEEVKKEISKGSVHTVKSLSDSIYKSSEKTKSKIQELSLAISDASEHTSEVFEELINHIAKASKRTSETVETLSNTIVKVSEGTSEEIYTLSRQITDSSEASAEEFKTLVHYISNSAEVTNNEISSLIKTLSQDRECYIETMNADREQLRREIRKRDEVFQDLVLTFRKTAAANEKNKKWWKFFGGN